MSVKSHRARARREWLRDQLGGCCCVCGTVLDLQFDFIKSDGGSHHALSAHDRAMAYIREFNRKNLQLLCGLHNREKYQLERRSHVISTVWKKEVPQPVRVAGV
jgi:hypothetical protein